MWGQSENLLVEPNLGSFAEWDVLYRCRNPCRWPVQSDLKVWFRMHHCVLGSLDSVLCRPDAHCSYEGKGQYQETRSRSHFHSQPPKSSCTHTQPTNQIHAINTSTSSHPQHANPNPSHQNCLDILAETGFTGLKRKERYLTEKSLRLRRIEIHSGAADSPNVCSSHHQCLTSNEFIEPYPGIDVTGARIWITM